MFQISQSFSMGQLEVRVWGCTRLWPYYSWWPLWQKWIRCWSAKGIPLGRQSDSRHSGFPWKYGQESGQYLINLKQLGLILGGKMEDLDNNWILLNNQVDCRNNDDNSPATLGLKNMRGVFILVGLVRFTWILFSTKGSYKIMKKIKWDYSNYGNTCKLLLEMLYIA